MAQQIKPSPPIITIFPISEFFYKLIRFSLHSPIVKSNNEIGDFFYQKDMECPRRPQSHLDDFRLDWQCCLAGKLLVFQCNQLISIPDDFT